MLFISAVNAAITVPLTFNPNFAPTATQLLLQGVLKLNLFAGTSINLQSDLSLSLNLDVGAKLGGLLNLPQTVSNVNKVAASLISDKGWGITTVPATTTTWDNAWYSTIKIGTPAQSFNLVIDSGSSDILLYDVNCNSCDIGNRTAFNDAASSTFSKDGSSTFSAAYGTNQKSVHGFSAKDTVRVGDLRITAQSLALIDGGSSITAADGLLGIASDALSALPGTVTTFSNMVRRELIDQPIVGIALVSGQKKGLLANGGEYRFGGINPAYILGLIRYTPVTSSLYWYVP